MRFKILSCLTAMLFAVTASAYADTLNFTLSGEGTTFSFSLPSNPVPDVFQAGDSFLIAQVPVTVDDQFGAISDVQFSNVSQEGGLVILSVSPLPSTSVIGPQIYSGPESSPQFSAGTFNLESISDNAPYTLVITNESPVPEPSTWILLGSGALGAAGVIRRRLHSCASSCSSEFAGPA
jgi:hypothetical protein